MEISAIDDLNQRIELSFDTMSQERQGQRVPQSFSLSKHRDTDATGLRLSPERQAQIRALQEEEAGANSGFGALMEASAATGVAATGSLAGTTGGMSYPRTTSMFFSGQEEVGYLYGSSTEKEVTAHMMQRAARAYEALAPMTGLAMAGTGLSMAV